MGKNKRGLSAKKFSRKFFLEPFPANHNPLIGMLHKDTLRNVHDAIAFLQELTVNSDDGLMPSESISTGYYFLTDCVLRALRFEIYNRQDY